MPAWLTIKIKTKKTDPFKYSPHRDKVKWLGAHRGTWTVERFTDEEEACKLFWELLKILDSTELSLEGK